MNMSSFNITKDLVFLVLQYLDEEDFKEAAHELGCESRLYFDLKYFEDMVLKGEWDEAENYLSVFTKVKDNDHSIKIYFEMRKQKYFEALDNKDHYKALDILLKDLKVFAPGNEVLFKELTHLLTVDNIREIKPTYQNENSARKELMDELKKIIRQHPLLKGKLEFPVRSHRLRHLLNESLKWEYLQNPAKEPELFLMDHFNNSKPSTSGQTNSAVGTTLELKTSTPSMVSDERDYKTVLEKVIPLSIEESHRKTSPNTIDICNPSQCHFLQLPVVPQVNKIVKMIYTNAGNAIVALGSNGTHLVWLWPHTNLNLDRKATAQVYPQLFQPKSGRKFMINDYTGIKCENPISSLALSKSDAFIISTSGGTISLFSIFTFKTLRTIMSPPPMVTSLAFYPEDNNIFAVGFDNSSILIYHVRQDEVVIKLEGHSKRVSALAFSKTSNILVSGDANAQIIVWNTNGWEKLKDRCLQIQGQKVPEALCETQIEFHPDHPNFLAVHSNSHLAIYEATELKCVNQWVPEVPVVISQATFSCDGHTVFSLFGDGIVAMFDSSNLQMHCRVNPCAFLSPTSRLICPISIAAHPKKPSQFAVGLTDGSIVVFEPRDSEDNWMKSQ